MISADRAWPKVAAVAALLLLVASCGGRSASDAEMTLASDSPSTLAAHWESRALNALLVPLLEPDGPLSWATPHELMPCPGGAEVRIDGRPVSPGKLVPMDKLVIVGFRLDDCWPLGVSWVGLSGSVEMTVVHDGRRLNAVVMPLHLTATVDGLRVPVQHGFVATLLLEGPGR